MGVATNTVGVDTSLTTFSPASAPSSKSRSTIAQLYGVDTHAADGTRAISWKMVAWQQAAETRIYVDVDHHRAGGGRELSAQLLRRLTERGYRQAFAGITQTNEASNSFHRSFGFQDAGLYRRAARKHDCWHDLASMQLDLLARRGLDVTRSAGRRSRPAPSGPLRNRQDAIPFTAGLPR